MYMYMCKCSYLQTLKDSPVLRRSPRLSQRISRGPLEAFPLEKYSRPSIKTYSKEPATNILNESGQFVPDTFDEENVQNDHTQHDHTYSGGEVNTEAS